MIDYLAFFAVSILTAIVFLISFKRIINEKIKFSPILILSIILGSVITTLLSYVGNAFFKNVFTIICFAIIFKISSKKTIKETFYYALILWICGITLDFINLIIVSVTGLAKILSSINILLIQTASGVLLSILIFLFFSIPKIKTFIKNTVEKLLKIKSTIVIEIILILTLILISVICVVNISRISITIFSIFAAILLVFLVYLILAKNYNINRLKEVNQILIKNNEFYVKVDSDYRILKHNLIHQLQGIKSVANDKTIELIDDLIISYNSNFMTSKDINKIPGGINGIIYEKFYSVDKDISLAVENHIESDLVNILKARTFNNLCEIIGILVDNAIEAAVESDEKAILLDFSEDKNSLSIYVSNTFNSELDIDKLGEKNYSTKGRSHGIGLFSIFRKNDIKIKTKIINNLFQTELKIKKASL